MRTGLLLSRLLSSCSLGFRGYGSEFRCAARYRGLSYSRHFSFGFSGIDIDVYIYIYCNLAQNTILTRLPKHFKTSCGGGPNWPVRHNFGHPLDDGPQIVKAKPGGQEVPKAVSPSLEVHG